MSELPVIIRASAVEAEELAHDSTQGWSPYDNATLAGDKEDSVIGRSIRNVSSEQLAQSMQQIKGSLDEVFASISEVGAFELSEIKLGLEVTAKGGFALIGSAEAGAKGAITLTFSPPKTPS